MPTTPHRAAGWRIEPPVSEPSASGTSPAADGGRRAARRPAGHPVGSWGLRVGPKAEFSVEEPMANSSRLVLPITIAPAARQALDHRGVVGGPPALEDPRASTWSARRACTGCPSARPARRPAGPGRCPAATVPVDRRRPAPSARVVRARSGRRGRSPSIARRSRPRRRLDHRAERRPRPLTRTGAPPAPHGPVAHGASPRIRGTRKRSSSTAGAWASTSSRSSEGAARRRARRSAAAAGARSARRPAVSRAATVRAWSSTAASCSV